MDNDTPRAHGTDGDEQLQQRARVHAALGDPVRLAIVDELAVSDRSPVELRQLVDIESNLLAHHLDVLEEAGMVERSRSSGDGRRRYVHLIREPLGSLQVGKPLQPGPAVFICSANSARSQLAAALWERITDSPALSAGTHPAERVHPGALDAASRAGLDLSGATPHGMEHAGLDDPDNGGRTPPSVVVTVCDRAHEELEADPSWLHWSVPDPTATATPESFDAALEELRSRITTLVAVGAET